jgi:L-proline amide hydrolase
MASEIPVFSSELDFPVPSASKPCRTSYTIFGDLKSGVRPLICLHGGPGVPHNYLLPIKQIAAIHGKKTSELFISYTGESCKPRTPHGS